MLLLLSPQGAAMNNPEATESAELDEFFRRGELISAPAHTLEPPMGVNIEDDAPNSCIVRSPEQVARRQTFIRYVSLSMGGLVLGLGLLFANQAFARRSTATNTRPVTAANPVERMVPAVQLVTVAEPAVVDAPKSVMAGPVEPVAPATKPVSLAIRSSAEDTKPVVAAVPAVRQKAKTAAADNKAPKAKTKSLVQTSVSKKTVVAATASVSKSASSNVASNQSKPVNYKPPTASFSD